MEKVRVYTNDVELERKRQECVANAENRLPVLRNRVARSKSRSLVAIALVARERGDRTVETEARKRLGLEKGEQLGDRYELIQSRRPSRSAQVRELAAS